MFLNLVSHMIINDYVILYLDKTKIADTNSEYWKGLEGAKREGTVLR